MKLKFVVKSSFPMVCMVKKNAIIDSYFVSGLVVSLLFDIYFPLKFSRKNTNNLQLLPRIAIKNRSLVN